MGLVFCTVFLWRREFLAGNDLFRLGISFFFLRSCLCLLNFVVAAVFYIILAFSRWLGMKNVAITSKIARVLLFLRTLLEIKYSGVMV